MKQEIKLTLLQKHRCELDITQEALAEMVGVSTRTIQRIESGHPTSLSTAKSIASVLELTSFQVLVDKDEKKSLEASKISHYFRDKINYAFVLKGKLLTFLAAVITLGLVSPLPYDTAQKFAFVYFLMPILILFVGSLKKPLEGVDDTPISFGSWLSVGASLVFSQLSALAFITLSLMRNKELTQANSLISQLTQMPGVRDIWFEYQHAVWQMSGIIATISLLALYAFLKRAQRKNESFRDFADIYIFTMTCLMLTGLPITSSDFFSSNPNTPIVFGLMISIGIYLIIGLVVRAFTKNKYKHNNFLASLMLITITGTASFGALTYIGDKITHAKMLFLDQEYRTDYCVNSEYKDEICWPFRILNSQKIATAPKYVTLLDAKNGQIHAFYRSLNELHIPKSYFEDNEALPDSFYQFYTNSYATILERKEAASFIIKNNKNKFAMGGDETAQLQEWALKAKLDFPDFIERFNEAPYVVKKDPILLMFYKTFTGTWDKKEIHGGALLYSAGTLSRVVDRDNNASKKNVSFDDLAKISSLDIP